MSCDRDLSIGEISAPNLIPVTESLKLSVDAPCDVANKKILFLNMI